MPSTRIRSAQEMTTTASRLIRAAGRACGREDPDSLAALLALHAEVDRALVDAIADQRSQGCTWKWIGESMGVTKEAAIMRWGTPVAAINTTKQDQPTKARQ